MSQINREQFMQLRSKAEALVHENPLYAMRNSKEDLEKLLHEVQIYQAELEIQNQELRDAQLELRATRDRYSSLYNFAPVAYFTLDSAGIVTDVNMTGVHILGGNLATIKGRALFRHIHTRDRERYQIFFAKVLSQDVEVACEVCIRTSNESRVVLMLEGIRFFDSDGLTLEVRITGTDISALRNAQDESKALNEQLEQRVAERTREAEGRTAQLRALAEAMTRMQIDERRAVADKLHDTLAQVLVAARMKVMTTRQKVTDPVLRHELDDINALLTDSSQYTRGLMADLNPLPLDGSGLAPALKKIVRRYGKIRTFR